MSHPFVLQLREQVVAHRFPIAAASYNPQTGCLFTCDNNCLRLWRVKNAGFGHSLIFTKESGCPEEGTIAVGLFSCMDLKVYLGVFNASKENFINLYPSDLQKSKRLFSTPSVEERVPVRFTCAAFNDEMRELIVGTSTSRLLVLSVRAKLNAAQKMVYQLSQRLSITLPNPPKDPDIPRTGVREIAEFLQVDAAQGLVFVAVRTRILLISAVSGELLLAKAGLLASPISMFSYLSSFSLLGFVTYVLSGAHTLCFVDVFQLDLFSESFHHITSVAMGGTAVAGFQFVEQADGSAPVLVCVDMNRILRAWHW